MAKRKLEVVILGDNKLGSAFKGANRDADRFGKQMAGVHTRVSKSFAGMTLSIAKFGAATAGLGAIGAAFTKVGQTTVGFDKAIRNVNSIAQLSEKRLGSLSKSVLKLAGKTAQAPQTLADGLYTLVSSGFKASDALSILEASAKAATAGLTDTETSTSAVAAVLNAYHRPAADAAAISDTLFQTVNLGVTSFEDLASNIGDVLPFASSLGVDLNQLGASIATLTKAGISPAETMTRLKGTMTAFIKPSKDMNAAIKATGAESGEALIKQKGFQGALEAVIGTTDKSKASVAKLFPDVRALGGALALTGKNAKGAHKDLKGFKDTSGATDKALKQQSKSIAYQWNKIKAQISAVAITVGSVLVPAFAKGLTKIGRFVKDAGKTFDGLKRKFEGLTAGGKSPIAAIGTMIGDGLKSVNWRGIGATIATGLGSAMDFSGKLPAMISQGISAAVGQVDGRMVLGKLVDILGGAVEALFSPSFWIEHFAAIFSVVTLVIPLAKILKIPGARPLFNFISKPVFKAIGFLGKGAASLLGKVGVGAMKGLWTGLSREFPRVTGFIGKIAGKAASALSGLPGKLKGIAGRAGGAVAGALANAAGRVAEAAGHLAGQAIKAIGRIVGGLASAGGRAVKALAKRLIPGPVRAAVSRIAARAVEVLHNLGARFVELGKNLIQGMVNGIKSKAADVANAAKDVAKGAFHAVTGFLDSHSPSRLFMKVGNNLVAGFVIGILSKREQVAAGLKDSLLFPIDAAIAALEKKKEKLQATWDKIDSKAEKSALIRALTKAKNAPIKFTVSSDGGDSGGGGGSTRAVIAGGKFAQGMGLQVGESKYFGGVTTNRHAHYRNDHYSGNSVDINAAGGGAAELGKLKKALAALRKKFGSAIQQAMIEDAGKANQHLHVTFKGVTAKASKAGGGGGKHKSKLTADEIRGLAYAAGFRGKALDTAVAIAMAESGGKVGARNKNSNGSVDRGLFQINSVHGRQSTTNIGRNVAAAFDIFKKAGNSFKDWVTFNSGAFKKFLGNTGSGKGSMPTGVKSNAGEHMGNIREATKALREFMRDERRAKKLAKIDLKIAGLQQLKAFKDAIKGIRDQVKDLAAQAAAVWRTQQEAAINSTHDATIKAIGESADAIELTALQKQDADEADAKEKQGLDDAKTEADKAVTDAYAQLQQDGSAEYKATWQKAYDDAVKAQKDAADAIEAYQRRKREDVLTENLANATTAADATQQTALDGLDQQEQDYRDSLETQLADLTTNLEKRKTTYAEWAKGVNAILNVYGLGVEVDPDTEAAVLAGPGGAPVFTGTHGAWAFGWGGSGPGSTDDATMYDGHSLAWWQDPKNAEKDHKWRWPGETKYKHSRAFKARALGGPVYGGETYLVGERGPELLTMDGGSNGRVTPNNRLPHGGGSRGGDIYMTGTVNIGSQKAARVMANRLSYRAQFG